MNQNLKNGLLSCDTDLHGTQERFANNETLYLACLKEFLNDDSFASTKNCIDKHDWDGAFTAIHALKGLAGNMGFVPLYVAASELVVIIRQGRLMDMEDSFLRLKVEHDRIVEVINKHLTEIEGELK